MEMDAFNSFFCVLYCCGFCKMELLEVPSVSNFKKDCWLGTILGIFIIVECFLTKWFPSDFNSSYARFWSILRLEFYSPKKDDWSAPLSAGSFKELIEPSRRLMDCID